MPLRPLQATEIRVLGTLMEKARTVPDSYPMTLNALVSGCNQKSSRHPLMALDDATVQAALDALKTVSLVFEGSGSRVTRFEHNVDRVLGLDAAQAAVLGLLMLRGPQTAGELRIHAERWHRFEDTGAVDAVLASMVAMADARGVQWVQVLPRAPGAREARWTHRLGDAAELDALIAEAGTAGATVAAPPSGGPAGLLARVEALELEVARLSAALARCQADEPAHRDPLDAAGDHST